MREVKSFNFNFLSSTIKVAITPLIFKNKLYKYPKDNFLLKILGKDKLIKMSGFDCFVAT